MYKEDMKYNYSIDSKYKEFGNLSNLMVIPIENSSNKEVIDFYIPLILDKSQKIPSYCFISSK